MSRGYPRQEDWSGLPFPSPGDIPDSEIESVSPALQADSLPLSHLGSPNLGIRGSKMQSIINKLRQGEQGIMRSIVLMMFQIHSIIFEIQAYHRDTSALVPIKYIYQYQSTYLNLKMRYVQNKNVSLLKNANHQVAPW